MKSLVLAEKPSVAKELARVLNCNIKNKGSFEGPKYVVTWALGHLVTLKEPDDYDAKFKQWRLEDLPIMPEKMELKVLKQTSHQYAIVKNLMKRADISELIIATDAGREGELVARWIMELANWRKPFKRLWISSQTDSAIREGFANLKPGMAYNNLFDAAVCRAEADWLIGLNVTRALACKFNAQLTAGRVQTPTLAMIVNREKEIKNFVPVDFWTLRADFGDYFGDWRNTSGQSRIFNYSQAEGLLAKLKGHPGVIVDVKTEAKSEPAPLAYDLTELQRDANRRYGFSAQKTLAVLQGLYERHKLVTYPRTDSRYISTDIVPTLPARLKSIAVLPYTEFVRTLLQKPLHSTKRFVDDSKVSDHHAIIPTDQPVKLAALDADELKIYDLIVRRFLAVLYPPYRYDQTTIITMINGENFYSQGKVPKDLGWRVLTTKAVEKEDIGEDKLPDQILSMQKKGESKEVKSVKLNKDKTKPPARYTEATLLTAMESPGKFIEDEELRESIKAGGLGTPATRAEIIEKLLHNFYVERAGKELMPTSKGMQLIELVPPSLKSPELTAQWEMRLSSIAKGGGKKKEFINDIREDANRLVQSVVTEKATFRPDNISKVKCPMCGKQMLEFNSKKGKTLVCSDRLCGHRQMEKDDLYGGGGFKTSKANRRVTQKLIEKYSDSADIGTNLGELLKAKLKEENKTFATSLKGLDNPQTEGRKSVPNKRPVTHKRIGDKK